MPLMDQGAAAAVFNRNRDIGCRMPPAAGVCGDMKMGRDGRYLFIDRCQFESYGWMDWMDWRLGVQIGCLDGIVGFDGKRR